MSRTGTLSAAAIAVPTVDIKGIAIGDIFSENSHYVAQAVGSKTVTMKHLESGETIELSHKYVGELLQTADQFTTEKSVNKEDSEKSGLGIRSIFENIGTSQVFQVCFTKQETAKTAKAIATEKAEKLSQAAASLNAKTRPNTTKVNAILNSLIDNPVVTTVPGEERILRGYKVQTQSRDGRYDCVDMDITAGNNIRPVNINTIKWLVVGGVKYTVK